MAAVIEVDQVSFQYQDAENLALTDVSFSVEAGEMLAVLGAHGAGKTTLCLCLNGIIPNMVAGDLWGLVTVAGVSPTETPVRELAKRVGMVFDNPEFQMSQLTALEEVAFGMQNVGMPRDEMRRRVSEVLETVGLAGLEQRSPLALSGGQQQRLAIASTLAMEPTVIVLDEPTTNLDPVGKEEVFQVVRRLNKERGMTVVITEHEVEVIAEYADRVIVLQEGHILEIGTPREVFRNVGTLRDELGLRVPQVSELTHRLRVDHGRWDDDYPVTLEEAAGMLARRGLS